MDEKVVSITIIRRVKQWKKLLIETYKLQGVDEKSSWVQILEKASLKPSELSSAVKQITPWSDLEKIFLNNLPWYNDVVGLVPELKTNIPNGQQFHIGMNLETRNVRFIYHKKDIDIFECYIISPEAAKTLKTDLLVLYSGINRVACISFVKKFPNYLKKVA